METLCSYSYNQETNYRQTLGDDTFILEKINISSGFEDNFLNPISITIIGSRESKNEKLSLTASSTDSLLPGCIEKNSIHQLHLIGHQLNKYQILGDLNKFDRELTADKFAGYQLSKLGVNLNTCIDYYKNIKEISSSNEVPSRKERITAFNEGWNMFKLEQNLYERTEFIPVYPKNQKKVDSLISLAKSISSSKPLLSANLFSTAFQHSNGEKIMALYNAFKQYADSKKYRKASRYGNEMLRVGVGFINEAHYANIFQDLGIVFYRIGENEKSLEFLNISHRLRPENTKILMDISHIYEIMGQHEKVVSIIKKCINIGPATPNLFFQLAEAYKNSGNVLEAIKYYKRIINSEPEYTVARINLAKIYIKEGEDLARNIKSLQSSKVANFNYKEQVKIIGQLRKKAKLVLQEGLKVEPGNLYLKEELKKLKNSKPL